MRLELTKNHPRANAVIKAVAEMADWKRKRPGRGLGLAFADYHDTLTAGVAEISVDRATGKIKVHNYWIVGRPRPRHPARECGRSDRKRNRVRAERRAVEELTVKDGAVQQSNFDDYPVLRMSDVPQIHMRHHCQQQPADRHGRDRRASVAPAIANAVFQLTGKRLRHLPMSPDAGEEGAGVDRDCSRRARRVVRGGLVP